MFDNVLLLSGGGRLHRLSLSRTTSYDTTLDHPDLHSQICTLYLCERARRAEWPKKQGSDKELFLVARVAIKYAGHRTFIG